MDTVKITYLGQCGFLLEGGGVKIVTDPYLSDYVDRNFHTPATPWKRLYPAPTTLEALQPDGIVISHAHGDHMDPDTLLAYIRSGGSASIAAPAPEADKVAALGAENVVYARAEQSFDVGSVRITPIPCAHTQLHLDDGGRFFELSYLIDFGSGNRIFFGGDMSLYDGLAQRLAAAAPALMLLPVNGRDEARTANDIIGNITAEEAASLAGALNVPFVPMHHDLYEINRCPAGYAERAAQQAGARIHPLQPMQSILLTGGIVHA